MDITVEPTTSFLKRNFSFGDSLSRHFRYKTSGRNSGGFAYPPASSSSTHRRKPQRLMRAGLRWAQRQRAPALLAACLLACLLLFALPYLGRPGADLGPGDHASAAAGG